MKQILQADLLLPCFSVHVKTSLLVTSLSDSYLIHSFSWSVVWPAFIAVMRHPPALFKLIFSNYSQADIKLGMFMDDCIWAFKDAGNK